MPPHAPTQPGGVGSLHTSRYAAGRSIPAQAEFQGQQQPDGKRPRYVSGTLPWSKNHDGGRALQGGWPDRLFFLSRGRSLREWESDLGFFRSGGDHLQQPRPPVIGFNQNYMMDTLEKLSEGRERRQVGRPRQQKTLEEIAPSLLHSTALPRGIEATTPTPSNRNHFEYEPTSVLPMTSTTSSHHSNIHVR